MARVRPYRLGVRTAPFQGVNPGSSPGRVMDGKSIQVECERHFLLTYCSRDILPDRLDVPRHSVRIYPSPRKLAAVMGHIRVLPTDEMGANTRKEM